MPRPKNTGRSILFLFREWPLSVRPICSMVFAKGGGLKLSVKLIRWAGHLLDSFGVVD
jgi:hypothetical protein